MGDKMNDVIDEVQKRLGEEYEVKRKMYCLTICITITP